MKQRLCVLVCVLGLAGCGHEPVEEDSSGKSESVPQGQSQVRSEPSGQAAAEGPSAVVSSGSGQATTERLGEVRLDPAVFGSEWKVSPGVVLESWNDMSDLPVQARMTLMSARTQMEPLGVIGLADYSCVRTTFPLNTVTVRVFRFKDVTSASAWAQKKYQYDGWEQHYTQVERASCFAVDSTQMEKRCIVSGVYWITSHHIGQGDLHLRALEVVMEQLELEPVVESK